MKKDYPSYTVEYLDNCWWVTDNKTKETIKSKDRNFDLSELLKHQKPYK